MADHPYFKANWVSKITFWWMNGLVHRGFKEGLEVSDLPGTLPDQQAGLLTETLNTYYNTPKVPIKRKLLWSLVYAFKNKILLAAVLTVMVEAIKITQPLIIGELVTFYQANGTDTYHGIPVVSDATAYSLSALLALLTVIFPFPNSWAFYVNQLAAMQMRTACCNLIYLKSLRLSQGSVRRISTRKIINMMLSDVEKFVMAAYFYHYLWIAILETAFVTYLLYREVGISSLAGLTILLLLLPLQGSLTSTLGKLRVSVATWAEQRISIMSEIIGAIRIIKMYCWEKPFGKIIGRLRKNEMTYIWKTSLLKGQNQTLSFMSSKIITFCIILTYYLLGNSITSAAVIRIISWTEVFKLCVAFFTLGVQCSSELVSSLDRIEHFLELEELKSVDNSLEKNEVDAIDSGSDSSVIMKDVFASWDVDAKKGSKEVNKQVLQNVNLDIKKGQLVAVIGDFGAGKSSLLMSVLGELQSSSGLCQVSGKIAYVPQEAWVFEGTIRENILFGQNFKRDSYGNTIKVCSLDKDFLAMLSKDRTVVGEGGMSLSAGQKARINLARAVYKDADIYLLDDPLSAVDTKVAKYIFEKCINRKLKDKTRILVTQQAQFLKRADLVVVMREGTIVTSGSYEEVMKSVNIKKILTVKNEVTEEFKTLALPTRKVSEGRRFSVISDRKLSVTSQLSSDYFKNLEKEEDDTDAEEENIKEESVGIGAYKGYFGAGYGWFLVPLYILLAVGFQILLNASDWLLSEWEFAPDKRQAFHIYIGLSIGAAIFGSLSAVGFFSLTSFSSKNFHNKMFSVLLCAPVSFFVKNSKGHILNRFSRDLGVLDDILPVTLFLIFQFLISFMGTMVLISVSNPWTIFLTVPFIVVVIILRQYTLQVTRDLKHIDSVSHGGLIGLSMVYIIALLDLFQSIVRQTAEAESFMSSVERVMEYREIKPETETNKKDFVLPPNWPTRGNLEFQDVSFAPNEDEENTLMDVTFNIHDKEKVGIVGGVAEKSSLIASLMRLAEPTGKVLIDGVNVLEIGLQDLRSTISIIPQDPVLFTGTLRDNLDPFSEYEDDQIWQAIAQVHLTETVNSQEGGLYGEMSEAGSSFSVGQRQLLWLARAILHNKKILLIDEATANVDPHTDELIQKTLRRSFTDCTVLCIAHRLSTIIDSDRVMVLNEGQLVEFDHPHQLLEINEGHLQNLVLQTGPETAEELKSVAKASYLAKTGSKDS